MLLDHCYEFSLLLKDGDPHPRDLFCLALDPPLGKYGQNIFMHVLGHEHFIPTKFRKQSINRFGSKGWLCVPIHIHALVQPPPLFI